MGWAPADVRHGLGHTAVGRWVFASGRAIRSPERVPSTWAADGCVGFRKRRQATPLRFPLEVPRRLSPSAYPVRSANALVGTNRPSISS
eukprot:scaffold2055_cov30-Tisochrysis_lutea.AAC.3